MNKAAARKYYREKRGALSAPVIEKYNDLLLIRFQEIPLPYIHIFHTYIPSEQLREPDTMRIVRFLQFRNPEMKVAAPRVNLKSLEMLHYPFTKAEGMVRNTFGIDEPAESTPIAPGEVDVVLVPLVAFDEKGHRVGYGKGFYDRFLAVCRPDVIKIGLCFFDPLPMIEDTREHDIPLSYCVTPFETYHWH